MAETGLKKEEAEDPRVLRNPGQTLMPQISSCQRAGHFQELSLRGMGNVSLTGALAMGQTPLDVTSLLEAQGSI